VRGSYGCRNYRGAERSLRLLTSALREDSVRTTTFIPSDPETVITENPNERINSASVPLQRTGPCASE
jgi:hypothetical protein